MTKTEAETLRRKWKQQVPPLACAHPSQVLEASESGYLTGNFHCMDCGEPMVKKV